MIAKERAKVKKRDEEIVKTLIDAVKSGPFKDLEGRIDNLASVLVGQKETNEYLCSELEKHKQRLFDIEKRETVRQAIQKEEGSIEERIRSMPQSEPPKYIFHDGGWVQEKSRLQKLIDICFDLVLTQNDPNVIKQEDQDDLMLWVARQLRENGFPTKPCGASWGVLE